MKELRISNYEIISAPSYDAVVINVKHGINMGWQPLGSISTSSIVTDDDSYVHYSQAMVMYEEVEDGSEV